MRVLIIDNYDSFTYNLYQYMGECLGSKLGAGHFELVVKRNDEMTLEQIKTMKPHRIVIAPGPGAPSEPEYFGVGHQVIVELGPTIPLLGVCLGMQGIAHAFGGDIIRASVPVHGKTSLLQHDGLGIYQGIPQTLEVMRYHSLIIDPQTLPDCLQITSVACSELLSTRNSFCDAVLKGCEIMGVRHKQFPIEGIQFHPESFATEGGKALLGNFLFGY